MPESSNTAPSRVAAVDLGSNSFHMIIAHLQGGQPRIVDRIREQVQLAAGLDENNNLDEAARERAFAALERFGQRVGGRDDIRLRAVGTNTLRAAKDARDFLEEARKRLGCDIEIISGDEEARLIYLGVAHSIGPEGGRRLVVDVGGGSTECILGSGFEVEDTNSVRMGCVVWSRRFFPEGKLSAKAFDKAVLAANRELHGVARALRSEDWEATIGASGTIRATAEILHQTSGYEGGIDLEGLYDIRDRLIEARRVGRVTLRGLKSTRAPVYPGGLAVLIGLFESLHLEHMRVSRGALREGLIYDILGRFGDEDVRERSIRALEHRFAIDVVHARAVGATATFLFDQVAESWDIGGEEYRRFLSWGARLHEIGLALQHDRYHRHGAYIVGNVRLPGFSRDEQAALASLILNHRRRFKTENLAEVSGRWTAPALKLAILLRLATVFNRSRGPAALDGVKVKAQLDRLRFDFPAGWLEERPLTRLDLEVEMGFLEAVGFRLHLRSRKAEGSQAG